MRRLRRQAISAVEKVATGDTAGSLSLRAIIIAGLLFAGMAALAASLEHPAPLAATAVSEGRPS